MIGVAVVMYLIEFFADKIPYVDTLWDVMHTAIRPVGGALIAVTTLGEASPTVEALIALLGGTVAAGSHLTKTSTRAAANTSPEPFSNWILSIGEDLFVVGLGYLALKYPHRGARRGRNPAGSDRRCSRQSSFARSARWFRRRRPAS